jgi:hypothetical protein
LICVVGLNGMIEETEILLRYKSNGKKFTKRKCHSELDKVRR